MANMGESSISITVGTLVSYMDGIWVVAKVERDKIILRANNNMRYVLPYPEALTILQIIEKRNSGCNSCGD